MAQGRILDNCISTSEKVADLSCDRCRLLYTWIDPHTDDFGLISSSPRTIKATVFPMIDCTIEEVSGYLQEMVNIGLLQTVMHESKSYYYYVGFERHQRGLKRDRQPHTILDIQLDKNIKENWNIGTQIVKNGIVWYQTGTKLEPNGTVLESEVKRKEVKRKEVNTASPKKQKQPPTLTSKEITELSNKYSVSEKDIQRVWERMVNSRLANDKPYSNWKAGFHNWIVPSIEEGKVRKIISHPVQEKPEELTPEEREQASKRYQQLKKKVLTHGNSSN